MINKKIDSLIFQAIFAESEKEKKTARKLIKKIASDSKINLSSTHKLYQAFGKDRISGFTVPAINIRGITYDIAQTVFKLMKEKEIGIVIFEIARSEIGYTFQRPEEYTTAILAAAIKTNYQGPVFIQGDHYQFKRKIYQQNPSEEINNIKKLIQESLAAGFYNIDIDASTLVDLNRPNLDDQQKENYRMTALMTKFIRDLEPPEITVSIGGEIGHIGGKNSTPSEFRVFMEGFLKEIKNWELENKNKEITGISKVSVQTGTSHGGVPLPDGSIAQVNLDFKVLKTIGELARKKYGLGGPVQHGASTLPNELFDQFPKIKTLEIHLATGFQNIIYDYLPKKTKEEIYGYLKKELKDEWKEGWTEEQFIYKTRKKGFGPFKKTLWQLTEKEKKPILFNLKKQFELIFEKLGIYRTRELVNQYV